MTEIFPRFIQNCLTVSFCFLYFLAIHQNIFEALRMGSISQVHSELLIGVFLFFFCFLAMRQNFWNISYCEQWRPANAYDKNILPFNICDVKAYNFTKGNTPPWVVFTFLKFYKWYQTHNASHFKIHTKGIGKYKVTITCVRNVHMLELQLKRYVRYS